MTEWDNVDLIAMATLFDSEDEAFLSSNLTGWSYFAVSLRRILVAQEYLFRILKNADRTLVAAHRNYAHRPTDEIETIIKACVDLRGAALKLGLRSWARLILPGVQLNPERLFLLAKQLHCTIPSGTVRSF